MAIIFKMATILLKLFNFLSAGSESTGALSEGYQLGEMKKSGGAGYPRGQSPNPQIAKVPK